MGEFKVFDAFRVEGWIQNGVVIAFKETLSSVKKGAITAAGGAIVAAAACFSTFAFSADTSVLAAWEQSHYSVADFRLKQLGAQFDAAVASFGNQIKANASQDMLALAQATLAAVAQRKAANNT